METATATNKRADGRRVSPGRPLGVKELNQRAKKIPKVYKAAFKQEVSSVLGEVGKILSEELIRLALHSKYEPSRISAIREIFDRVLGKAPQPVTGEGGDGPVKIIFQWRRPEDPAPGKDDMVVIEHDR